MKILKAVKEGNKKIKMIDLSEIDDNPQVYETYFKNQGLALTKEKKRVKEDGQNGDEYWEKRQAFRQKYTVPRTVKRNESLLKKRQAEFNDLSGGLTPKTVQSILLDDEYTAIKLYYGLENELAKGDALKLLIKDENGNPSSRQWASLLKARGLKKIFLYKLIKLWNVPLSKLPDLMSNRDYGIISRYYGLHIDPKTKTESLIALTPRGISTQLNIPESDVINIIKRIEQKLATLYTSQS